jgi:hypothetical protein
MPSEHRRSQAERPGCENLGVIDDVGLMPIQAAVIDGCGLKRSGRKWTHWCRTHSSDDSMRDLSLLSTHPYAGNL